MKRFERILIQLALVHFILLVAAQFLLEIPSFKLYTNKSIYYEGVIRTTNSPLWKP
ncbi:DUF5359 family protein [Fictibacillus nanhaiensis]|uniref:DUF5359 family protein n=1 Tax=Fictibacillus nanhaiensis TaxID=742169 RepID=A0ABS2ZWW1_9BACL|nr:DUF5359 family protein [Fictibacillus nanhaiensis]